MDEKILNRMRDNYFEFKNAYADFDEKIDYKALSEEIPNTRPTQLTKKQKNNKLKSKAAKQARKKNRK